MDDFFKIFKGTTKELHKFFEEMNEIHPNLKFTFDLTTPQQEAEEDRCDCQVKNDISFLYTLLSIKNGRIKVDLGKASIKNPCSFYY